MRFSAYEGDRGYRHYRAVRKRGLRVLVRLDGVLVDHCVMADTKRGVVVCDEVDEAGQLVLNARGDTIRRIRRFGKVELEITR